jgi:hypothetical protein
LNNKIGRAGLINFFIISTQLRPGFRLLSLSGTVDVRQPIQHTAGHTMIVDTTGAGKKRAFGQKSLDNVIQGLMVIEERPTLAKLRRYLEGGLSTLVIQALERYYNNCLGDWRRDARKVIC